MPEPFQRCLHQEALVLQILLVVLPVIVWDIYPIRIQLHLYIVKQLVVLLELQV